MLEGQWSTANIIPIKPQAQNRGFGLREKPKVAAMGRNEVSEVEELKL